MFQLKGLDNGKLIEVLISTSSWQIKQTELLT